MFLLTQALLIGSRFVQWAGCRQLNKLCDVPQVVASLSRRSCSLEDHTIPRQWPVPLTFYSCFLQGS